MAGVAYLCNVVCVAPQPHPTRSCMWAAHTTCVSASNAITNRDDEVTAKNLAMNRPRCFWNASPKTTVTYTTPGSARRAKPTTSAKLRVHASCIHHCRPVSSSHGARSSSWRKSRSNPCRLQARKRCHMWSSRTGVLTSMLRETTRLSIAAVQENPEDEKHELSVLAAAVSDSPPKSRTMPPGPVFRSAWPGTRGRSAGTHPRSPVQGTAART
mmetsp:Transcript_75643/g.202216  ORF Transcript_75643/g.202216 Transcript_75643/m.202216 type:complete len:213 (-) Transcript_75643:567-1205(-)